MAKDISQEDVHHAVGEVMHPAISRTLVELRMVKRYNFGA
jgi:metal-sulfur cluster biosynthetic enzyme